MASDSNFQLTLKQKEAIGLLSNGCRNTLLYGGGRSAKTFVLLYSMIVRALMTAKSNHLVARKTFQSVKQSLWFKTWEDIMTICFPVGLSSEINENKDLWFKEFPNGSRIWFGGLDDKERVDKVLGNEYSTIFLNECSEMRWDAVSTVRSRLAEKNSLINKMYYDCNPTSSNHWSYRLFIKKESPDTGRGIKNPSDYQQIRMNPQDNLANIDPQYIQDMESAPEATRKRFLLGEFAVGMDVAVYKEEWMYYWRQMPSTQYVVCSWDTAQKERDYNDPTCGTVWAVSEDGYYLIDIINERMDYPKLRQKVIDISERYRADEVIIEDKSSGTSLIQDLRSSTRLPIVAFEPGKSGKVQRAMYSSHLFEQKKVFLPFGHELVDEYRSQLLMFPLSEHDDMVDSTSQFLAYAKDNLMHSLPSSVYELDDYEELGYLDGENNRNTITGY